MTGTLDARKYWSVRAASYRDTMDSAYHRNRLAMIDALLRPGDLAGRVLDIGCGDGVYAERVLREGGRVHAIDIDASMVQRTRTRLDALGRGTYEAVVGGVDALAPVPPGTIDTMLELNVLAYMSGAETAAFYAHARRVLRPGGVLVVTHSNELFDLYTLNRYTVDFFERHFSTHSPAVDVRSLLTHPEKPDRPALPCRANPLNFRHTLGRYGLDEEQQEFAILHPLPPLLVPAFDPDDIAARECLNTLEWPDEERWKLMFMCSVFGSRSIRTSATPDAPTR